MTIDVPHRVVGVAQDGTRYVAQPAGRRGAVQVLRELPKLRGKKAVKQAKRERQRARGERLRTGDL